MATDPATSAGEAEARIVTLTYDDVKQEVALLGLTRGDVSSSVVLKSLLRRERRQRFATESAPFSRFVCTDPRDPLLELEGLPALALSVAAGLIHGERMKDAVVRLGIGRDAYDNAVELLREALS